MTYSESKKPQRRKNNGLRRLIGSWVILFLLGAGLGVLVGKNRHSPPVQNVITGGSDALESVPQYGTRDGRTFIGVEMSRDWGGNEAFITLDCRLDGQTQQFIYYLAKGYFIDFTFVMGLIRQESSFRPTIVSKWNDYGLMQINVANHDWLCEELGIDNLLDPEQNVRAGLYILRVLFEKYDDPAKVLMAYNLGEYGAKVLWDKGIYETEYTNSVLAYANTFENQIRERRNNGE
jgi:hypothetical protein